MPDGTTIAEVYDQAGNGLLFLGEPGAGKSILLYDLAQVLLTRTQQDEAQPLPVILNLSSWTTKYRSFEAWLVEELQLRYLIPRRLSQYWLKQAKLLPLLDGLDEVEASARDACIEAINAYHSKCVVSLVVCSRLEEYQEASGQLTLQRAVTIQPLTTAQVWAYLKSARRSLAAVRQVVSKNEVLLKLLTTPLWLSVVTLTYKDKTGKDLPKQGDPEQQKQQIFERYVERMLERRTATEYYTPQDTQHWLAWLAQQMQQHHLTEFYLEWLRPGWLPTKQSQITYTFFKTLLIGLAGGGVVGLLYGLIFGIGVALRFGLINGLNFALAGGLGFGLSNGVGIVFLFWLFQGVRRVRGWLGRVPLREIRPSDVLTWSWKRFWLAFVAALVVTPGVALVVGSTSRLVVALVAALLIAPGSGLLAAVSVEQIEEPQRLKPNQAIQASGWNALRSGLIGGVLVGLGLGLFFTLFNKGGETIVVLVTRLGGGLGLGLGLGLFFALVRGWEAFLAYHTLLFVLRQENALPWHYERFLNAATERVLLQRVGGGGYRFIHPLFRDYFASQAATAEPEVVQ